jgi:hypothetical protein
MTNAVELIANGRVELRTQGKTEEGQIKFNAGLTKAVTEFSEVQSSRDLFLMLLAEYIYTAQELASSRLEEIEGRASCEAAMRDFDDAFRSLEAVGDERGYCTAEKAFPRKPRFRYKGMPRDAFHLAYMGHRTRVRNTLRKIGFDPAEQTLMELRLRVFNTAQEVYLKLQQTALSAATG